MMKLRGERKRGDQRIRQDEKMQKKRWYRKAKKGRSEEMKQEK